MVGADKTEMNTNRRDFLATCGTAATALVLANSVRAGDSPALSSRRRQVLRIRHAAVENFHTDLRAGRHQPFRNSKGELVLPFPGEYIILDGLDDPDGKVIRLEYWLGWICPDGGDDLPYYACTWHPSLAEFATRSVIARLDYSESVLKNLDSSALPLVTSQTA